MTWERDDRDRLVGTRSDVNLSAVAKLVLFALADYAGKDTCECWPTIGRIAHDTGLSVRSVQRGLKQLVAAKLIERSARFHDGRRTSDLFTLQIEAKWLAAWNESRGDKVARGDDDLSPEPVSEPSVDVASLNTPLGAKGWGDKSSSLNFALGLDGDNGSLPELEVEGRRS